MVGGKSSDMSYICSQFYHTHKRGPRIVVMNLSRSRQQYLSYEGIEAIKDGVFCSTKYECSFVLTNNPWIIIMANWLPNEAELSADRWVIKRVDAPVPDLAMQLDSQVSQTQPEDDDDRARFTQGDGTIVHPHLWQWP